MSAIVLGVSGGIAAYKAALLLRMFTEGGDDVHVIPTASSYQFVGKATWEALSGNPVRESVFTDVPEVAHVRTGQHAELVVVAPATANILAKTAHGIADDMLGATLLTATCPVIMVPAMHTEMWLNAATQHNVRLLRDRGVHVMEPASGRLTGTDTGPGRFPDPEQIYAFAQHLLAGKDQDLTGKHLVVSAGGTREFLDPVRWLGNRSSGRQGFAIAEVAAARGAQVTLVAANTHLPTPLGVEVRHVVTTAQMRDEVLAASDSADAVIMAAAPADFRPAEQHTDKIKKSDEDQAPTLALIENPDILRAVVKQRRDTTPVIIGFAAETGDSQGTVMEHAQAKLARKGCDYLVVNDVSGGKVFGESENEVTILAANGDAISIPRGPKSAVAHAICDAIVRHLG